MRGAPYGRSPPSSRPLPAGLARLGSALPAPFPRSSKGFLHPALPAGLGGRRWEAPCPCPARGPLMGDPSQSPESPHNPQSPLTTLPSQPPMSPHNAPLTASAVPPSSLAPLSAPIPQQPPLLHTNEPLLPVSFQAVSSEALHKPLGVSGGISAPGRDSGWRQVANIHQG